jgi:PAS domain S-box-containing protein
LKKIDLDKLLHCSVDMICTIDKDGRFVFVSDSSLPMFGYRPEEMSGRLCMEFVYPDDIESTANVREATMNDQTDLRFQNRYIHKDGHLVSVLWSARWDPEGELMYCIAKDGAVTKQAEGWRLSLEESNKRYKYVTKATVDAIWDWDIVTGTLYWGDGFETIFGYKTGETPPAISDWTDHIHPADIDWVIKSIYSVIEGNEANWKAEYRYLKADGSYAHVVDRGFVIRNKTGLAIRMVGAMHDITERKESVQELKRFAEDLYKHNRDMHQFAYIVSHNLRSPVANIMGITNLMELDKDDPETLAQYVGDLKKSVNRLDDIIKDLSKILSITDAALQLKTEELNMVDVLKSVQDDLTERITGNHVVIHITEGVFKIYSNAAYIYSIFFNLMSNAIKYGNVHQPVVNITINYKDHFLVVEVSDNGIGLDISRHQEDLFKPYKKFHSGYDGKGLGLFLVKSHLEALGGEISIESSPGHGTCFTVLLPCISQTYDTKD